VSPSSGNIGDTFTWATSGVSGGNGTYTYSWSGTDGLSGTTASVQKAYAASGTKTGSVTITSGADSQTFTCTNSVTGGNSVTVNSAPAAPTATLSADDLTVDYGQSTILRWNSSNATSCVGNGFTAGPTSGSRTVGPLTVNPTSFGVTCTGPGGSATANVSITVLLPNAFIRAEPGRVLSGNPSTISWGANLVNSCTVTGPSGTIASGPSDVNRSFTTGSPKTYTITAQSTYTIHCLTNGNPADGSVTVNVGADFDEF